MSNRETSVFIALIHNNNPQRNNYIRPRLKELQDKLSRNFSAQQIEVSFQPEIRPHGIPMAMLRDVVYETLGRDWMRYCHIRPPLLLRHIASFLRSRLKSKRYTRAGGGAGDAAAPSR